MGPKKKGKGSKLARMSEEERLRYMQHRAAIEEEARRRKEQLIATFMKNKLKHEEAFMRLNSAKINQQWRQILRKVKCKELKDNMTVLWKTFEAAVMTKNKVIESLLQDLEDSEVQYSRMLGNHVQVVNRLIGLHQDRLETLNKSYTSEKRELLDAACSEHATTQTDSEFACEFLQTVIFDMNSRNKRQHKACTSTAAAKQDELRNQMQSEIEKVEEQGGLQIEGVWRGIQQVLKDYVTDTAPNRPHYNALRSKDKTNTEQLLRHCHTVNKYSDLIVDLKQQLATMHYSQTVKLKELKDEQSDFLTHFEGLRQTLNYNQARDENKLTTLSVTSSDVIKDLTKLTQKGEAILQIATTCQKFLSEKEKLRNYSSALKKKEESIVDESEAPFKELDNFWQQYNEVVLECDALNTERDMYIAENKQLHKVLRHYLNSLVRPTSMPRATA